MAIYAIGDLQGCYDELMDLLDKVRFEPRRDRLWFCGDLVNRGPRSLDCLRFVKALGERALTVLGNHELHLLAIGNGRPQCRRADDTLDEILNAPDRDELLDWLRQLPLMHRDERAGFTLLHAGLPPQWSIAQALRCAGEVEQVLRQGDYLGYFANMYGNEPACWSDDLGGWERLRFITNCLSRLRYCTAAGRLDLAEKGMPGTQAAAAQPWFEIASRKTRREKILFGHWASLRDYRQDYRRFNVYPLDRGCVWGGELAALRLEDETCFCAPAR